jgi:hypothetical protein
LTPSLTSFNQKEVMSKMSFKPINIVLKSEILDFEIKRHHLEDLTFLIPVTNIFEIFYLEINNRIFSIENLKIFELAALEEKILFDAKAERIKNSSSN